MTNAKSNILIFYKPIGVTALDVIKNFRNENPEYRDVKLGYAGRLDPMAEGVLLVLVDDENKKRKKYEKLSKEYEFEVVFGLTTDSYDLLGLINNNVLKVNPLNFENKLKKSIKTFVGTQNQKYPPFSSKTVNGKPLYWWARKGRLNEIQIPKHKIELFNIEYLGFRDIKNIKNEILKRVKNVKGNFRQKEIISKWQNFFNNNPDFHPNLYKFRMSCSSGTYVRQFVFDLGKKIETAAICFSIKRTKVGVFEVIKCNKHCSKKQH